MWLLLFFIFLWRGGVDQLSIFIFYLLLLLLFIYLFIFWWGVKMENPIKGGCGNGWPKKWGVATFPTQICHKFISILTNLPLIHLSLTRRWRYYLFYTRNYWFGMFISGYFEANTSLFLYCPNCTNYEQKSLACTIHWGYSNTRVIAVSKLSVHFFVCYCIIT